MIARLADTHGRRGRLYELLPPRPGFFTDGRDRLDKFVLVTSFHNLPTKELWMYVTPSTFRGDWNGQTIVAVPGLVYADALAAIGYKLETL